MLSPQDNERLTRVGKGWTSIVKEFAGLYARGDTEYPAFGP